MDINNSLNEDSVEKVPDDHDLIYRTQCGDLSAFDEIIRRYNKKLYHLIYQMTFNHEDVNDLLQQVFEKAYRSIDTFRSESHFYTWMHSIAVHLTINFLRKKKHMCNSSLDDPENSLDNDIELVGNHQANKDVLIHELHAELEEAINNLSEEHRSVVQMFDIDGMHHAEIAKILNISSGTVRSRLFYAHQQLKNELKRFRNYDDSNYKLN